MPDSITRRKFARTAGGAAVAVLTSRRSRGAARPQRVVVHGDIEIGEIRPELHGHFAEHLGSCIYGGLWVGRDSPIPNVDGCRRQAVEYLRELGVPVLRWPGGCFADDYHWRDGVGPPAKRPKTVNIHWGGYTEDNSFGTHEFIRLCRLIAAEPYLAGNVGSGTPAELRDWVEYCNYPEGSTLAAERAANGSPQPFGVRYWGVGNENWGCGGRMRPEEYAAQFRRFATYMPSFGGVKPFLIAAGPSRNDVSWTRGFMDAMRAPRYPDGFAMHFYSRGRDYAVKFTPEHAEEQLSSFADLEKAILQQRALLDSYDPDRKVGLLIDEWGVWDRMDPEEERRYGRLWQQSTMRSAVAAGLGLNVFHRQAEKLVMCNIAQTVNVLQSVLLTRGDHCIRTSTYYAFELMKPHRSKTAVAVETGARAPLGLSVSSSRTGQELAVSLVHPGLREALRVECALAGCSAISGRARILHHEDLNACNTFENPDVIVPREHAIAVEPSRLRIEVPPLSIVTAVVRLSA